VIEIRHRSGHEFDPMTFNNLLQNLTT